MKKLYFATSNPFKLSSAQNYFKDKFEIKGSQLDIDEPQSLDQEYVAKCKVNQAFKILKQPVFCEDVGLYIEKYNSFPGVLTAFILKGIGLEGMLNLISEGEPAYYKAVISYKDGENEITTSVIMKGKLTIKGMSKQYNSETSKNLFKYIFIADGYNVPVIDLSWEDQLKLPYNTEHYQKFLEEFEKIYSNN
ncbi:MAG TPA: non-canonical purine NTP pyrophosphatase [Rickettsiales bacterium]|nr:non-canonical purine NTP pyrophosphatase [Rickettsiales bacterium]